MKHAVSTSNFATITHHFIMLTILSIADAMECEDYEYNCLEGHPPCIHTSMICDGAPHCMINDDEKTCGEEKCNFY